MVNDMVSVFIMCSINSLTIDVCELTWSYVTMSIDSVVKSSYKEPYTDLTCTYKYT